MTSPKPLPPIGITRDNTPISPAGNSNGKCCGRCGCAGKSTAAPVKAGSGWLRKLLAALNIKEGKK